MKREIAGFLLMVIGFGTWHTTLCRAETMGTAFTYQGRFMDGGSPADDEYDFEFKLYDDLTSGTQQGSAVYQGDVEVSDGYFTVTLDFGSSVFDGDARWLEIGVRPGESTGAYTTLTPRHELTPASYAMYSARTEGIDVNDANVGIGTSDPQAKLHIDSSVSGASGGELLRLSRESAGIGLRLLNFNGNDISFSLQYDPWSTTEWFDLMAFSTLGRIGIGTTTPAATLHVDGTFSIDTDTGSQKFYITRFGDPTDNQNLEVWVEDHNVILRSEQDEDVGGGGMIFETDDDGTSGSGGFRFRTKSGTEFVRIDEGKVGIGTTDPIGTLDVNGPAPGLPPNILTNGDIVIGAGAGLFFDRNHWYPTGNYIVPVGGSNTQGFFTAGTERMRITADGDIGIGTASPTEKLEVDGDIRCDYLWQNSDEQLKTDVQPLGHVLEKLDQIRGVSFQWNEKAQAMGAKGNTRHIGVLAQEIEQVFPELVTTPEPVTLDELLAHYPEAMLTPEVRQRLARDAERSRYKAVSYSNLTAVLLEAVKELRAENQSLQQRIEALEDKAQ